MEGEKGLQGCVAVTTRRKKVAEKLLLVELGQENPKKSRADREASVNPGSLGF